MDDSDFEGTLVLEQLAAIGKVEDFFDAGVHASTIATVIKKMEASDGEH